MKKIMEHRKTITPDEFNEFFANAEKRIFRVEALPEYNVPEDRAIFDKFASGVPLPDLAPSGAAMQWFSKIKQCHDKGISFERLRLISGKITPYLRYEIDWCYTYSQDYGEETRFAQLDSSSVEWQTDFFAFDDSVLIYIDYDTSGSWQGFSLEEDPERRKTLLSGSLLDWEKATTMKEFLAKYRNKSL